MPSVNEICVRFVFLKNVVNNKMSTTDRKIGVFFELAEWLFNKCLAQEDKVSLHTCKKLVRASPFLYESLTTYLSENNAAKILFIAINLATVVYQYAFSTWFMYLVTSVSGFKKLFSVVLQNPVLGVFFYLSFYFRLISETDRDKFNTVAELFNLPLHQDFVGATFLTALLTNVGALVSRENVGSYSSVIQHLVNKLVSEQVVAQGVERVPTLLAKVLTSAAKSESLQSKLPGDAAVYVEARNEESQSDIDEFREYVTKHKKSLEKHFRSKKRAKTRAGRVKLQQVLEKRDEQGKVVCLDRCKQQTRTKVGCYCESECGPTMFFGNTSWCFVDPTKCKKAQYLPKYLGKPYDMCEKSSVTKAPLCFTGYRYTDCITKK